MRRDSSITVSGFRLPLMGGIIPVTVEPHAAGAGTGSTTVVRYLGGFSTVLRQLQGARRVRLGVTLFFRKGKGRIQKNKTCATTTIDKHEHGRVLIRFSQSGICMNIATFICEKDTPI